MVRGGVLLGALLSLTVGACSTSAERDPVSSFPRPLGAVERTKIIGAPIPTVQLRSEVAPDSHPTPVWWPVWWAVADVDGPATAAMRRFDRSATGAGLDESTDDRVVGCTASECTRRWSNDRGELSVEVGPWRTDDPRLVARVEWVVHLPTPTRSARAVVTPRDGAFRPTGGGLGPGVTPLIGPEDTSCGRRIGVVDADPGLVWRRWNHQEPFDDDRPSIEATIDGRTVKQLVRNGMDYGVVVTMISGPGLPKPILAGEFCS